jgi:ERCC4-type nuclease
MMTPKTHRMIMKIDIREHDLFQYCKQTLEKQFLLNDVLLVSENLPVGDIIIADNLEEKIIIERKTLADLAASIKDGRYNEQSYRLNGIPHHNHNIIYLIEGDVSKYNIFKSKTDKNTLYSAMFSINYYKGFSVMRSNSLDETALMLCNMVSKMLKSDKPPYYKNKKDTVEKGDPVETTTTVENGDAVDTVETVSTVEKAEEEPNSKDYCSVVKKIKKDNVTVENIGEIMLCQIPGISSVTAIAILSKFKNFPELITEMKKDPTCLNSISYVTSNGQSRKISKACIASIIKFLIV